MFASNSGPLDGYLPSALYMVSATSGEDEITNQMFPTKNFSHSEYQLKGKLRENIMNYLTPRYKLVMKL